jgi:hypothetical protein
LALCFLSERPSAAGNEQVSKPTAWFWSKRVDKNSFQRCARLAGTPLRSPGRRCVKDEPSGARYGLRAPKLSLDTPESELRGQAGSRGRGDAAQLTRGGLQLCVSSEAECRSEAGAGVRKETRAVLRHICKVCQRSLHSWRAQQVNLGWVGTLFSVRAALSSWKRAGFETNSLVLVKAS